MLSVEEYLKNPCRSSAIPYWKLKSITIPSELEIIHDKDFSQNYLTNYVDEPYFRLSHNLKSIAQIDSASYLITTATIDDIDVIVELINQSYCDLEITYQQLLNYTKTAVYDSELWILLSELETGLVIACGIADFDRDLAEGILEWIQVLPAYRNKGIGQIIVNELLSRLANKADFVTVSGKLNNKTKPEKLYRKCGFKGQDVWHVLKPRS